MATAQMAADTSRLSFAKVAASAGKENAPLSPYTRAPGSIPIRESRKGPNTTESQHDTSGTLYQPNTPVDAKHISPEIVSVQSKPSKTIELESLQPEIRVSEATLVDAVKALTVNEPLPGLVVNGSGIPSMKSKVEVADGTADDAFSRADSGSELGTKPPSLDGKSITSGTTFALDEKESLRPDDSASVKAAEDDDTFSGRGSIVASSRIGSEAGGVRAYRTQFYEAPERRGIMMTTGQPAPGAIVIHSALSSQQIPDDGKSKPLISGSSGPEAFNLFYRQTPDEKLLEALESPKDRIFLLRLEQDVIEFVRSSKEPFIDLPPCNSFCRMLTHKLADYYHMTHQVDAVAGAVRIFRTPFCRLPPSLTSISNPPTSGNTPPPTMPTMKIMRRGGEGDSGPSPSKAASETGSDGKDKSLSAKEKLSREEREAAYNKARERIFGKEEKSGEATPETEEGNEMSRSSSVSTKDRAAQSKRLKPVKQRRDDSEGFDVRSQYTAFFPQQQTPTWVPATQYPSMAPQQFGGPVPNNFPNPMPQQFLGQQQQYNTTMPNNGNPQLFNNMPQQYPQANQQRFQQHHSAPISAYGSPVQSPPLPPQQWPQQAPYQNPYPQQAPMARGPPIPVPYAFGQLPNTVNPADPKSQHPIPGSFNRHAFNPKTQSFVPGSGGMPIPQPMSHHGSPHHGSPHHGSPHLPYNAFSAPQPQFGGNMGYNMARQGSNNSLPSYHASPLMGQRPMMHQGLPQGMPHGMPQALPPTLQHGMHMPSNGQIGSHLPNYGNPSTLPPKPPTGI